MVETVKQTAILEKTAVFDESMQKRYELKMTYSGIDGKRVLVIGMNPASDTVQVFDLTTNHLLNNLGIMGFSEIIVWNLFPNICTRLKTLQLEDNEDNMEYLDILLQSNFDAIIVGYGNTYIGNKKIESEKQKLFLKLKPYMKKVYELTDKEGQYQSLRTIHPLFAGQRFNGNWKLKKYIPSEKIKSVE